MRLALFRFFEYDFSMIQPTRFLIQMFVLLGIICGLGEFSLGVFNSRNQAHAATFKFRLLAEPISLDWHVASSAVETPILMNMMEGLMEVDPNLKPKTCLAEKMVISKDQKVYTFFIRKNAMWSDGVPLKARDFVEGWKRLLTASTAAPYAYLLFDVVGAEEFNQGKITDFSQVGIVAKDEHTLEVTLKRPIAYFPYLAGFWPLFPVRHDLIEKYGTQWTRPGKLVTVGPYYLESYQIENKLVLKANPHYWRTRGNVTEVVVQIIKDSATALKVFRSGGIQLMVDFSPDDLKQARAMPEFRTFPYLKTHYLAFRVKDAVSENLNFRQALIRAIDKKPIPQVLNGTQKVSTTIIPPKVVGYDSKMGVNFDVAEAKEYLKKSGIDPEKTEIQLVARNSERPRILAQYIQAKLKENLGLHVQIQLYDHKVFRSEVASQKIPLMLMVWAADYPDGDSFMGLFESNTGNNLTHYSNPKYDENIAQARMEWNTLKREKLYREAQEMLQVQDAAILPLYYEENEALVAKNVKGFTLNPIGYFFIRDLNL